jgi:hypothetical protein
MSETKFINKTNGVISDNDLPKIYCFINGANSIGYFPVGLAEDGECICEHCSSSPWYAKHDIGFNSEWKHEKYLAKYPQGFQLIWLEQEDMDGDGIKDALRRNQLMAEQAEPAQ